jgi:hydrogenase/urease accessory protein HupE
MRLATFLVALLLGFILPRAEAHEMTMAEMEVREAGAGEFFWQWTASGNVPASQELSVTWPAGCTAKDNVLHCGEAGLKGEIRISGMGDRYSATILRVRWREGGTRAFTLTSRQPVARVYGAADDPRDAWEVSTSYLTLGVEHILSGLDHLLFVIGLLFLVGFRRQLVVTITAFTVAHSLTLALSALGWLTLRPPPVEATIALSIMLVAGEALHKEPTLSRRWPALVAFLFGLMHGLGFAGALSEIGLPEQHLLVALLTFNVGVEVGQLLVVGSALLLYRLLARNGRFDWLRTPALYGIGALAGYWTLERTLAMFS